MAEPPKALPAQRAFVVQLAADCAPGDAEIVGRVEHIRSGEAEHFAGASELVAFMQRVRGVSERNEGAGAD